MARKVIVIGANHWNTLGVVRSIGEKKLTVILFLERCTAQESVIQFSKYVSQTFFLKNTEDVVELLTEYFGNELVPPVILCASDMSISCLDRHYEELKGRFSVFNVNGTAGRICYYMDKINLYSVAERCGINLVKTWHVVDKSKIPNDVIFPCFIKGNNSTTSNKADMAICNDFQELQLALHEGVDYLIQEYIKRDFEICIVGFAWNHGRNVYLSAGVHKIRDDLMRQTCWVRLDSLCKYPEIKRVAIKRMIREIGYEGIFSLEFICKSGIYYLLEMNLRNDACGYLYTAAGVNYPYLWYLYSCGELTDSVLEKIKVKTPSYFMSDADFNNMREGKVGVIHWFYDIVIADAYSIFSVRDLKPVICHIWRRIKRKIEKMLGGLC